MFQRLERLLLWLCILFLPTQLAKHFWPDFSDIFSLPIDYLAPRVYFWDLLVLFLIVIWIYQKPSIHKKALTVFLIFILSQLVSMIASLNPAVGFVRLEQLFICGLFGVYIGSQKIETIKNSVIKALGTTILFQSLLAIFQFVLGRSVGLWIIGERSFNLLTPTIAKFNFYEYVVLRPYGTFPHPNVLAGFIVTILPLINYFKSSFHKLIPIIGGLASILTFSRVGTLVLLLEAGFYLRKKILILLLILTPLILVRFGSVFNFDYISVVRREELALTALSFFQQSPLFGIGLNNFISHGAVTEIISGQVRFFQPVHNIYLLSLSETGLVGFLGLGILIGYPIYRLWINRKDSFSKVLLYCWGILLFLGMFDHYLLTLAQGQRLLFLIWGFSFCSNQQKKSH